MSGGGVLVLALLVLVAPGCVQKSDWIEGTLVTADVSGVWRGLPSSFVPGDMEMSLTQRGAKVTGDARLGASKIRIEGTVRGDVLSFSEPGGRLIAEATVTGDEMSGWGRQNLTYPASFSRFTFTLTRSPKEPDR